MGETETAGQPEAQQTISARSVRLAASAFNIGNLVALSPGLMVMPLVLLAEPAGVTLIVTFILMVVPPILWFGLSMVVYAIVRHHPEPRVGHYAQLAAYRFYGALGVVIPVGTFFGTDWRLWIITGGLCALVIVPWSIIDLVRIRREQWQDLELPQPEQGEHHA
ncbi:MAG: hypothetical protein JSW10_06115 [Pseudomonadota bacterium]|nr:MAG: hypothetical protein JSW10_06115 [Pseudomonadota bacterium]